MRSQVHVPAPAAHHTTLQLVGSAAPLWIDGKVLSAEVMPQGVSGVERMDDGSFVVAVGSGSYDLVLA